MSQETPAYSKVRNHSDRAFYDADSVEAILDSARIAHVGYEWEGHIHVIPVGFARRGAEVILHGSPKAGLFLAIGRGAEITFTVTHLDGLVVARSGFHSSMNYRSVSVHGVARLLEGEEKSMALDDFLRFQYGPYLENLRPMKEGELTATVAATLSLEIASAKIRDGGPKESEADHALGTWAGVVPVSLTEGVPIADEWTLSPEAAPNLTVTPYPLIS